MMTRQNGFSLIELMATVAILGVIASIAYPQFADKTSKSRREDAQVALVNMGVAQEKFYLQNNTYTTNVANVGGSGTEKNWYVLSIPTANASSFTLTATAQAGQAQATDLPCLTISLTSAGQKTPPGCWQ